MRGGKGKGALSIVIKRGREGRGGEGREERGKEEGT